MCVNGTTVYVNGGLLIARVTVCDFVCVIVENVV